MSDVPARREISPASVPVEALIELLSDLLGRDPCPYCQRPKHPYVAHTSNCLLAVANQDMATLLRTVEEGRKDLAAIERQRQGLRQDAEGLANAMRHALKHHWSTCGYGGGCNHDGKYAGDDGIYELPLSRTCGHCAVIRALEYFDAARLSAPPAATEKDEGAHADAIQMDAERDDAKDDEAAFERDYLGHLKHGDL